MSNLTISTKNGTNIERVMVYKYLGIYTDENISFKHHISNLASKLRQKIGFFYRNKSCFPLHCRKTLVEATFLSVLDYGDILYRYASAATLKPLDSVYHSALRFITGDPYSTHHCTLYNKVGWSSLSVRRDLHLHLFTYKAIIGMLPLYVSSLLTWPASSHHTRSNDWLTLHVPRVYTELGRSAFSFSAPSAWNSLQSTLKMNSLVSFGHFKSMIVNLLSSVCTCFN